MNKKINFDIGSVFYILAYSIIAVVFSILQTTLSSRFNIYNAIPDIVVGSVIYLGIYRGKNTAALFGLFTGLCVDGLGNFGISFLPFFYCIIGIICGHIGKAAREGAKFAAFSVSVPAICLARVFITYIDCLIKYGETLNYKQFLLLTALPEFVSTLALCFPVFLITFILESPLNLARKMGWID